MRGYHSSSSHNYQHNRNNNQGGRYYTTSTEAQQNYLVLMNDEDDFNSSAYNGVFIDDVNEPQSNENHVNSDEQENSTTKAANASTNTISRCLVTSCVNIPFCTRSTRRTKQTTRKWRGNEAFCESSNASSEAFVHCVAALQTQLVSIVNEPRN